MLVPVRRRDELLTWVVNGGRTPTKFACRVCSVEQEAGSGSTRGQERLGQQQKTVLMEQEINTMVRAAAMSRKHEADAGSHWSCTSGVPPHKPSR